MKKLIFAIIICCLIFSSVAKPVLAFSGPSARGGYLFNFENAVFKTDEMNLQSFVNETMKAIGGSIFTTIFYCYSCTKEEREQNPGLLLSMIHFLTGVYASPPASAVQYFASLGDQLGIVKPVYAQGQGTGYNAMKDIMAVWKAFRNLSYVFFALILVFIGFAIMFRLKISPQAVATLQSALPRIILALILVTFSYAIVGLFIDLMYVMFILIANIFIGPGGIVSQGTGIMGQIWDLASKTVASLKLGTSIGGTYLASAIFFGLSAPLVLIAVIISGPVGWFVGFFAAILIFIAILRCAWVLLKAYTMVIINLVFAPLQIMVGAIPGSNAIGNWFKNLLANLAVMPTMIAMFFLSAYLIFISLTNLFSTPEGILGLISSWTILGGPTIAIGSMILAPDFFWQFFQILLLPIVGIVILLMAPKASDMIKAFIAGQPFAYGTAIGEAMGPAKAIGEVPIGAAKWRIGEGLYKSPRQGLIGEIMSGVGQAMAQKGWFKP